MSGGIGTGKSSVLAAIRSALRAAGVAVLTRPPRDGDDPGAAVVIDDAHLLDDAELGRLVELVADPASTVVVAAEPLAHHTALRSLATAIERENPVVSLGALSPAEVSRLAAETLGAPPTSEVVRSLMVATAGLPFLLQPAIAAAGSPDGEAPATAIMQAAKFALIERLRRLDEPVLDTLLVSSLSPDLGPDDVAAALRVGADEAQALVDRARASGLIEPSHSHTFLRSVHRCIAQIIGTARHHDTEISLLVSQIESSTLSADLALRMAEHGLQDDRLANALAELAARSRGQPARAARLYRAAADAGATALSARLADALALTGDCTTAGRLADELLGSDDAAERAAAVRIAASIAMHDGSAAQAADLFRWLGPYPDAFVSAAGAIVAVAAGDLDAARAALSAESAGPPTSTARAARSLAEGLLLSLDQPFPIAVARLGQSITAEQQPPGVAPDTPAALVTLAALHGGDPVRARSVIGRAVRAGSQTDTATSPSRPTGTDCCSAGSGCRTGSCPRRPPMSLPSHGRCGAAPPRRAVGGGAADGDRQAQRRQRCGAEALVCGDGGARRILDGPVLAAAAWRAVGGRRQDASGRPAAAHPDRGVRSARVARQSRAVVGAVALGGRARRDPGQFAGSGCAARPGVDRRGGPQRIRQGAGHRGPHLAAGAGQPRRHRRGRPRRRGGCRSSG